MAPNGFTQRFRGKIQADNLWIGAGQQTGPGAYVAYSTGGTQDIGLEAMSKIVASSGASVFDLPAARAGQSKTLLLDVSSALFLKAPDGGGFNGTTLSVAKSTYDMQVSLIALSSIQYAIQSAYPDSTAGGAPVGGLTLSTTT